MEDIPVIRRICGEVLAKVQLFDCLWHFQVHGHVCINETPRIPKLFLWRHLHSLEIRVANVRQALAFILQLLCSSVGPSTFPQKLENSNIIPSNQHFKWTTFIMNRRNVGRARKVPAALLTN